MATSKSKQILKDIEDTALIMTELKKVEDDYYNKLARRTELGKRHLEQSYKHFKLETELKQLIDKKTTANKQLQKQIQLIIKQKQKELDLSAKELKIIIQKSKLQRKYVEDYKRGIRLIKEFGNKLVTNFKETSIELFKIDSHIKQTILGIGLSGERAAYFRDNLNQAAIYTSMIGVNATDLAKMQKTYADETGRALLLSKEELITISNLAKGTLLGAEGAAKLAGSFELIGYGAGQTANYIEEIVNSSQKAGINADKVVKRIAENFKKSQNYNFRNGIRGLAEMSKYAEKFKADIGSTFGAMDKARTLEGAIDMAANLQVIGGQFASSDPFQLLHLSRNDPQKFQKMLNEMTRGVAQFNKTSGEIEITSLNLDRLRLVAEATGQDFNNLVEQSIQFAKVSAIERNLFGLSKEDKELVSSLATFDTKSMKWEIKGAGDISKLNKTQLSLLRGESQTLKQRAEASIAFNEQTKYLVDSLKATLLPLLTAVNKTLLWAQPAIKALGDLFSTKSFQYLSQFTFVAMGIAGSFILLKGMLSTLRPLMSVGKALTEKGGLSKVLTSVGTKPKRSYTPRSRGSMMGRGTTGIGGMGGKAGGGALGFLSKGATSSMLGFDASLIALGFSIGAATEGISKMAVAFEKLNPKQIEMLNYTLLSLGAVMVGTLVPGILLMGKASEASAVGLAILGGTILAIGAGIGMATAGIGYMVSSISKFGEPAFANNVSALASNMAKVVGLDYGDTQNTFGVISDVLKRESAMKEFGNMVNALKGLDNVNNPLSELKDMFKNPLKVQFDSKSVNLSVNLDVNLDSSKLYTESNIAKKVMLDIVNFKNGSNSPNIGK